VSDTPHLRERYPLLDDEALRARLREVLSTYTFDTTDLRDDRAISEIMQLIATHTKAAVVAARKELESIVYDACLVANLSMPDERDVMDAVRAALRPSQDGEGK
jgi:hypothetical protein